MNKSKAKLIFNKYGMFLVLLALFIICACLSEVFLTKDNLLNVARQVSIIGIVSIGMTFVILTGGIDLSVGPTLAGSSLLIAGIYNSFSSAGIEGIHVAIICFIAALAFGALVGFINGIVITVFEVQPFIVTLGMMTAVKGVGLLYSDGSPIIGTPPDLQWIGQGKIFGEIPVQAILFIIVAVAAWAILKYTPLGRYTYAIGGNQEASRLSGINVKKITTSIYSISGLLAGFAGVLMATQLNIGEAKVGDQMEMDAIAAVVIGGTSLKGGVGSVIGTIIGVLIMGFLSNLLNLISVPSYYQMIFKGVIIVGATILQSLQERKKA